MFSKLIATKLCFEQNILMLKNVTKLQTKSFPNYLKYTFGTVEGDLTKTCIFKFTQQTTARPGVTYEFLLLQF